ncbi:MAG: large-conductance mechanosensitive channel protein MscL [Gammaproteobacteria bacterium]
MRGFLKEFREFAVKGNAIDMAVGIVIGVAFGLIIKSLVADIIMPPIGLAIGHIDFKNLFWVLHVGHTPGPYHTVAEAAKAGAVTLNYGAFINTVISFIIIAFVIFMFVRSINKMRAKFENQPAPADPTTKDCPQCCTSIPIKATRCPNCTSALE